eukprot:1773282-Rhodomonas_salina.3
MTTLSQPRRGPWNRIGYLLPAKNRPTLPSIAGCYARLSWHSFSPVLSCPEVLSLSRRLPQHRRKRSMLISESHGTIQSRDSEPSVVTPVTNDTRDDQTTQTAAHCSSRTRYAGRYVRSLGSMIAWGATPSKGSPPTLAPLKLTESLDSVMGQLSSTSNTSALGLLRGSSCPGGGRCVC